MFLVASYKIYVTILYSTEPLCRYEQLSANTHESRLWGKLIILQSPWETGHKNLVVDCNPKSLWQVYLRCETKKLSLLIKLSHSRIEVMTAFAIMSVKSSTANLQTLTKLHYCRSKMSLTSILQHKFSGGPPVSVWNVFINFEVKAPIKAKNLALDGIFIL